MAAARPQPPVLQLTVRPLRCSDRAACEDFQCGGEPWQQEVAEYLHRKYWLPGRPRENVLLGEAADQTPWLFGFGAWKHQVIELADETRIPVVRVGYFAVDERYQGAVDQDGHKLARRLYASVEATALAHADTAPGTPMELVCHAENERGQRFWRSLGFEYFGDAFGPYQRFIRNVPA